MLLRSSQVTLSLVSSSVEDDPDAKRPPKDDKGMCKQHDGAPTPCSLFPLCLRQPHSLSSALLFVL